MASVALLALVFAGCFSPDTPTQTSRTTGTGTPMIGAQVGAVVTTEMVLCLDVSGSISSSELQIEINGLKACLRDQVVVPQDGSVAVGIVVYGRTAAKALAALTPITAANLTNVIEPVLNNLLSNRLVNTGATNINDGLIKSREILATGTTSNEFILLVGDGAANTGGNPAIECQNTANAGITICSIAVGASSAGITQLRDCALATGGGFGNAPTFNDFLPVCRDCLFVIIVGQLNLDPAYDLNPTGTSHTVTATATSGNTPFPPIVGATVNFLITSGPNVGLNGSDVTDANGQATFTWVGNGGVGVDVVTATMTDPATGETLTATAQKEWFNSPPNCDAGGSYSGECGGDVDIQLQSNSSDPDGDALTYLWSSDCPGASFDDATSANPILTVDTSGGATSCTVSLVVSDPFGASDDCQATVDIVDTTAPVITGTAGDHELWPPNHKYNKISVEDCIESITDACEGSIDLSGVEIVSVSSDEVENMNGKGDGNTLDDIVIECPNTVYVRSERQGTSNGRVYTITYAVADGAGNVSHFVCQIGVPHDQGNGNPAVDGPGPGYTETGCNPSFKVQGLLDDGNGRKLGK
jgi:hypothetical protein